MKQIKSYHICRSTAGILGSTGTLVRFPENYTNQREANRQLNKLKKENTDKNTVFFIEFDWILKKKKN